MGISRDGGRVAASGLKGLFSLWDARTGKSIYSAPENPKSAFPTLSFSPDGRFIATANRIQNTLNLWNGLTGQPIERGFTGHTSAVEAVAFSPEGRLVASGGHDNTVRLWDVETGEPIGLPMKGVGWVKGIAFSADGQRIAAADYTYDKIRIWDGPVTWRRLLCQRLTRNMTKLEWNQYVGKELPYIAQCPNLPIPD